MTVRFHRRYPSAEFAEEIRRSVHPDNTSDVTVVRTGNRVTFRIVARSAGTARASADDLLACVAAAERARRLAQS